MAVTSKAKTKRFIPFSLDAINFLLAGVRGALGPCGSVLPIPTKFMLLELLCVSHWLIQ